MKTALNILKSMRPIEALLKNGFVAAALVFGQKAGDPHAMARIAFAYVVFWLVSCCTYIMNDVLDRSSDREHPTKKLRPIASGALGAGTAVLFAVIVLAASFGVSAAVMPKFALVAAVYFALQLGYSFYIKNLVLVDAMAVAMGFLLRVMAGAVALDIEVQSWLLVSTLLLALLLAFAKRRHELVLLGDDAKNHRGVLARYSPYFLDPVIGVVTAATLITYCLYTMWPDTIAKFQTRRLPYTIPFVFYGIFRYLYLVHHKKGGGHVGRTLLTDPPLLVDIFLWGASVLLIIYVWPK
jgi:4-hydroxybenzoate polyprenyltransferase